MMSEKLETIGAILGALGLALIALTFYLAMIAVDARAENSKPTTKSAVELSSKDTPVMPVTFGGAHGGVQDRGEDRGGHGFQTIVADAPVVPVTMTRGGALGGVEWRGRNGE
jgi:hypothetical protein